MPGDGTREWDVPPGGGVVDLAEVCGQLRVCGPVALSDLAIVTGRPGKAVLAAIVDAGLAGPRVIAGMERVVLSPAGRERAEAWCRGERGEIGAAVAAAYREFGAVNDAVKQGVSRWQLRALGAATVENDHADARYDAAVLAELGAAQRAAEPVLGPLAALRPRYERVRAGLLEALRAAERGERDRIAGLRADSFHSWWWRLHAELLWILERARGAGDA